MLNRMDEADQNAEESPVTGEEKDSTYKIPFNMNELESLIDSALSDMGFGGKVESVFADFNTTLKAQESEFIRLNLHFNTSLIQINVKVEVDQLPGFIIYLLRSF